MPGISFIACSELERHGFERCQQPWFAGKEGRVRFHARDLHHLAAFGECLSCRRCLAKERRRLAEPALDGAQPVGKIFSHPPHQEIGAADGAGQGAALARQPERGVDDWLQRAGPCFSAL
jgi:hypothetical protein